MTTPRRTISHELADQIATALEQGADRIRKVVVEIDQKRGSQPDDMSEVMLAALVGLSLPGREIDSLNRRLLQRAESLAAAMKREA